jgi:hypothetical protein
LRDAGSIPAASTRQGSQQLFSLLQRRLLACVGVREGQPARRVGRSLAKLFGEGRSQ